MSSEEELNALRQRRLAELKARAQQEQLKEAQLQAEAEAEAQKQVLMRKILTLEARQRLQNVKLVRPDFAAQIELQLLQLAQSGRVSLPITDELLKKLLKQIQIQQTRRDINIRRI
jgi:programmed cell death protein 5